MDEKNTKRKLNIRTPKTEEKERQDVEKNKNKTLSLFYWTFN